MERTDKCIPLQRFISEEIKELLADEKTVDKKLKMLMAVKFPPQDAKIYLQEGK